MNAHVEAATASEVAVFVPPFDEYSDEELLMHFLRRESVAFFSVADPDQVTPDKLEGVMRNVFDLAGESHEMQGGGDWLVNPSGDVEWHILLHKFYYAVGLARAFDDTGDRRFADHWVRLTESWISVTPPGFIAADVTGRRVQNWIYAYRHFVAGRGRSPVPPEFNRRFLDSIHQQVEYLCANLTPARNHRTLELYAIFLAGVVFPEMRRARFWRDFALREIVRNMQSDLLSDGVQCELSTDYHHLVLKNYLCIRRLAALNGMVVPEAMDRLLVKALEFSLHAHKPDGVVPSLSDGDARSFLDLLEQGAALYGREDMRYVATAGREGSPPAERCAWFRDSGYAILRSGWGSASTSFGDEQYLIMDCGPLGAGNHGHFDCLNIELAAFGRSLVVDPGRYTYSEAGSIDWRSRFRGTAAHNTVTVDGLNQTKYLPKPVKGVSRHAAGSIRHKVSGPAPDAELRAMLCGQKCDLLHGIARSHEYDTVHERMVVFIDRTYWVVADWLHGMVARRFDLRYQLSEVALERTTLSAQDGTVLTRSPNLVVAQPDSPQHHHVVDEGWVSYRYGEKLAAPVLRTSATATAALFLTVLVPFRDREPRVAVSLDGSEAAGHAIARIDIADDRVGVTDWVALDFRGGSTQPRSVGGVEVVGSAVVRSDARGVQRLGPCRMGEKVLRP